MARLPVVAIIGRPNTGKSTLFNKLARRKIAIESDIPGTTRDHISHVIHTDEMDYLLVDTGGMGGGTDDKEFESDVHSQSLLAIEHADLILFTVNAREELTSSDREVVKLLRTKRRKHVPVILVVTKVDNQKIADEAQRLFGELGIADEMVEVSAINNLGVGETEEIVIKHLQKLHFQPQEQRTEAERKIPRVAIIGKPNVGKSSIVNALMSESQREESPRLVSDIAGTTRDATDTIVRHDDAEYVFVDTAGLKRNAKTDWGIDSYAMLRSIKAIESSDIIVLVVDASAPIARQDQRIAGMAVDAGKGLIILLNKVDLLEPGRKQEITEQLRGELAFCRYAPLVPVSAKTREGLLKVYNLIDMVKRNRERRIAVKDLQRWLGDTVYGQPMSALASCKHIVQAEDPPPTFVLFVKNPKTVQLSQLRYLDNRMRESFGFEGTPIRWITKGPKREYTRKSKRLKFAEGEEPEGDN